jgi:uncharacterized protein (TIGR03435 family)
MTAITIRKVLGWTFSLRGVGLALGLVAISPSQVANNEPSFEAASVRPASGSLPGGRIVVGMLQPVGGPGTSDPGRISYPRINLKFLLMNAYGLQDFQIMGPKWLEEEWFEVEATMPPDTTKEKFRGMLANLVTERFRLQSHYETRELRTYSLVVAKNGAKVKKSAETTDADEASSPKKEIARPKKGEDGYVVAPRRLGIFVEDRVDRSRWTFQQTTMETLAGYLQGQIGYPVVDDTGLLGKYDFIITFSKAADIRIGLDSLPSPSAAPSVAGSDSDRPPDIVTAVRTQLGLTLRPKEGPVNVLVVDHMEKTPTEN